MEVQQQISSKINGEKIGHRMKVVIDRLEGDFYIGRTEFDSPEVDGEVLIDAAREIKIGNFYLVRIIGSEDFDLYAELCEKQEDIGKR
jgi:ribosomal protein S12 methylthiotransferase